MIKNDTNTPPMSRMLGRRLLFSLALVALLIGLMLAGVLEPNQRPY